MTNRPSTNPFVYDRLSFPGYYSYRPCLDTEWLLSTLFDASLLSTSKAAGNGGSFFAVITGRAPANDGRLETILTVAAGLFAGRGQCMVHHKFSRVRPVL